MIGLNIKSYEHILSSGYLGLMADRVNYGRTDNPGSIAPGLYLAITSPWIVSLLCKPKLLNALPGINWHAFISQQFLH